MATGEKLNELLQLLQLEQIEENIFRAQHPAGRRGRLYGGQIMAQALMAGGRTVSDSLNVHSLHGYFLRPGDPKVPAVIRVERARDGQQWSYRVWFDARPHAIRLMTDTWHAVWHARARARHARSAHATSAARLVHDPLRRPEPATRHSTSAL